MRSKAILGVLAAVGLVVVFALAWRFAAARAPALGASGAPERSRATRTALQSQTRPVPAADEISSGSMSSVEQAGAPSRELLAAPRTARIRVVHADSGKAVPGARAWIELEEADSASAAWRNAMRRFNDLEPVLQSGQGREVALDERGEALVPQPGRWLTVVAVLGKMHGRATLGPEDLECVVRLEPYRSLACEVVDSSGRPVQGALVALSWGEFDPFEQQRIWITGADGRAWIARLEDHLDDAYEGELRLYLAGGVPGQPESVTLDMNQLPEEPVRFVAGEHGSVSVQVTDQTGKPLEIGGQAFLDIQWDLISDPGLTLRTASDIPMSLEGGRAVFERAGLGLQFMIGVSAKGYAYVWRSVLGPVEAGENVQVLVCPSSPQPTVRGRVHGIEMLSKDGSDVFVTGQLLEGYGSFGTNLAEDWTFECPVWIDKHKENAWALEVNRQGSLLARTIAVPVFDEELAVLDFGDVAFAPGTELARFHVVDDHGAAVASALVDVQWATGNGREWCDEAGCCVLRGQPTELPLHVQAWMDEWLPSESVPIATPGSEVTLTLRRGARLQGRIECPPGGDLDAFELQMTLDPDEPDQDEIGFTCYPVEGGGFRFPVCEGGSARLSLLYCDCCMLEREDIELRRGETTELVLDLRDTLHSIELSCEIEGGEAWKGGLLHCLEDDGSLSTWAVIGDEPRATLLARAPVVNVWVTAEGARPRLCEGVRSGDHLLLPRAPFLLLRIPPEVRLPDQPLALVAHAERREPEEVPYEAYDELEAVVGADGTACLRVSWPGEYELSWVVRNTLIDVEFGLEQERGQIVVVPERPASSPVAVNLTPVQVARAVTAAGG